MLNKINYVLDNFKKVYRINEIPVSISYGVEDDSKIRIIQGNTGPLVRGEKYIPGENDIVWKNWKGTDIPFFFGKDAGEIFIQSDDQYIITQDIIASAFYLLSGWQEYTAGQSDGFSRYQYSSSVQCKLGICGKPVVNYYFDILKSVIEKACGKEINGSTWGGKKYVLCLTHDIDKCQSAWLEGSLSAIKKGDLLSPFNLLIKKLRGKDAWFNFEEILKLEKQYGAYSTFFFLATGKTEMKIKNADYNLRRKKLVKVQEMIESYGSETGIHGSSGTSEDAERLKRELKQFRVSVEGNRFHFLLYNYQKTGEILDGCGLEYDSSMGFAEQAGFRNSFCFPFHPWDIKNDRPFGHIEIPLVIMDGSLQKYLHLTPASSFNIIDPLFDEIKKFGGCLTVLWHNTHFSEYKYSGWKEVYKEILDKAAKDDTGLLSCRRMLDQYQSV